MGEILKLVESLGGRNILFGIALTWIIIVQDLLKTRAKEDREAARESIKAAEKRAKGDREAARESIRAAEKRAKGDREAGERRSKEDREVARAESAKNAAEHAELSAAIHGLQAQVGILIDRANRSGPGAEAD